VGWRVIEDPATGARLGLPEKLVPNVATARTGSRWTSAQGQIQVETFRLTEASLPALFEEEKKTSRRQITSSQLKSDSFIVAGTQGLKDFAVRAEVRGSEVRGVTILYDQATEGRMERISAAMIGAFSGFPDPNAGPPRGVRRRVEYGTAIVVSADGDLIAPGSVIEECQTITVPGRGYAERIAEDKSHAVALIRLYGVRNLAPAVFSEQAAHGGEVTLVGIADPLAQAGEAAVASTRARLAAQALDPAPKPGFSGAAAIDVSGAFAGMVDLRTQTVAANGPAGQNAALVPADEIRSFLHEQGVTVRIAATDRAPMEQSLVRVVCVRK